MSRQVSALVLAAGSSRRMGRQKQVLPLGGRPAIRRCLDTLLASGVTEIIVVAGTEREELLRALEPLSFTLAINDNPASDMAASVRTGLARADAGSTGVLVYPSDHPLVTIETVKCLIKAHARDTEKIVIPVFAGRRGHPTLFPRRCIESLSPGETLRGLIRGDETRVLLVQVDDEGAVLDMDTPEDYEKMVMIAKEGGK
jgi:molybdenum cofactor cytidylyltransferase